MPTITGNVIHLSISSDLVEAVRLISKIDFYGTQCLPSSKAKDLCRKLRNFVTVRKPDEYTKFMQYYGLDSLADENTEICGFAEQLDEAQQAGFGVVISIEG